MEHARQYLMDLLENIRRKNIECTEEKVEDVNKLLGGNRAFFYFPFWQLGNCYYQGYH